MAPKAKLNTSLPAKPSSAGSQGSNRDQKAKAAPKVSDRPSASKLSGSPEGNAPSTAPPEVKSSKSTAAAASSESFVQARPTLKGPLSTGGKSVIKKPKPKPVVEEGPKLDTEEDFDWGKSGGWTVDKWCESLELHTIIASALDVPDDSPFEHVKKLTKQQISEHLRQPALLDGLIEQLVLGVEMLQSRAAASAEELNKKFQMDGGGFEMAFGSLDLFFGGLEGVIGPPQMIDGSLHKAMKAEHTTYKDSNKEFKSANGVTTTSAIEWELVAEPDLQKAYPDRPYFTAAVQARAEARAAAEAAGEALPPLEGAFASASPSHEFGRSPMAVEAFEALVEEQNARLRKHNLVEIILVEALAGRLYTGPMYEKYNAALRQASGVQYLIDKFNQLCKGNNYATTIHAINSAVLKLSKLTQAVKVWRGFKGATLPKEFFQPNSSGVRGGIEYGFSSTTTDRAQAVSYAQGSASTIFEMQMGMVDRGADLSWLSQYPHEKEVLFPPLTGLEALETEVDGSSLLIITRLSLNMTSLTLEQVLSRRRKTLMDMKDGMKMEVEKEVPDRHSETATKILSKAIEWGHLQQLPEWFNNDDNFSSAVQQALGVKQGVINCFVNKASKPLPLDVTTCDIRGWTMEDHSGKPHPGRRLLIAGWLSCKPAATAIDIRECKLNQHEAETLAAVVSTCPKLITLNVLKNETMGVPGAMALGQAMKDSTTLRSLCGIMPTSSTLEVPRKGLNDVDATIIACEIDTQNWVEQAGAAESKVGNAKLVRQVGKGNSSIGMNGWNPLIWAAKEGNPAVVSQLLLRGHAINVNEDPQSNAGFTPLMWAAYRGHAQVIDILLDHGADPLLENNAGRSAAALAAMRGFKNIAELLTFVGLQIKKDKQSFGDVIHRASLIKQATKSFRNVVTHAGPKVQASMDDVPAEVTVQKSVTKIQALVRGKSMRDVLETVTTEVQAAPPQAVANLARQAMLTSIMAKKFKDPVMPRQRVGFVTGLATPDTAPPLVPEPEKAALDPAVDIQRHERGRATCKAVADGTLP